MPNHPAAFSTASARLSTGWSRLALKRPRPSWRRIIGLDNIASLPESNGSHGFNIIAIIAGRAAAWRSRKTALDCFGG
jgi:hypothetical protein